MIDEIDARLTSWVKSMLPDAADVTLGPPAANVEGPRPRVGLYLFALGPASAGRTDPLLVRDLTARYLVTTHAARPEDEHRLLGALLKAAVIEGREIEVQPLPAESWTAFGLPPRPCFFIDENVPVERPVEQAPLVRLPVVVREVAGAPLEGRVLGPRSIPIARALVQHLGLGQVTTTDGEGRFWFPLVPAEGVSHRLEVQARGVRQVFTVDAGATAPIALQLQITEG